MARKNRNQLEGRSRTPKGRKLHNLADSETEEELKRFLKEGSDIEAHLLEEEEEADPHARLRPYRIDQPETFGGLAQFWISDN
jgi:hypothetical protein